jgi:hypothetical protein
MYLAGWKEALPVGEVHASPAGRKPFQPARMCLAGRVSKDTHPRVRMWLPPEKAAGYPDAKGPALVGTQRDSP